MNDRIKLILGTMTFGIEVNLKDSNNMVQEFLDLGYNELDTAYVYNEGKTEKILGALLKKFDNYHYTVATKVHPRVTSKLDGEAVRIQLEESLKRMERNSVDILYFHFPDLHTPLNEALEEVSVLHQQGKIKELGLSNFPSWMVVDVWHLCKKNGWPLPTVYQGMYNGLCRNVESELIPAIRRFGMRFYAFNPLAGGLITGKYTNYEDGPQHSRFSRLQSYRDRYWKRSYFEAVRFLVEKCSEMDIDPAEAAYRWLAFHSLLDQEKGDGIIIGATNMNQHKKNLAAVEKGVLPRSIINAFSVAWELAKWESPEYFNFFVKKI